MLKPSDFKCIYTKKINAIETATLSKYKAYIGMTNSLGVLISTQTALCGTTVQILLIKSSQIKAEGSKRPKLLNVS